MFLFALKKGVLEFPIIKSMEHVLILLIYCNYYVSQIITCIIIYNNILKLLICIIIHDHDILL